MRVDAFFLADAVTVPPDGKFYIHGGGLSRIVAPGLPFAVPQLAILARLAIDEEEATVGHSFSFSFTDREGAAITPPLEMNSVPDELSPLAEGEDRFAVIAVNVAGLVFAQAGAHRLEFRVDGDLMATISLPVVVIVPPAAPQQ